MNPVESTGGPESATNGQKDDGPSRQRRLLRNLPVTGMHSATLHNGSPDQRIHYGCGHLAHTLPTGCITIFEPDEFRLSHRHYWRPVAPRDALAGNHRGLEDLLRASALGIVRPVPKPGGLADFTSDYELRRSNAGCEITGDRGASQAKTCRN